MTAVRLQVRGLSVRFPVSRALWPRPSRTVTVVQGVDLDLAEGELLGLVGESGCGKTTLAKAIAQLIPASGSVELSGRELTGLRGSERRQARRDVQLIFQDPTSSLNPRLTVRAVLREALAAAGAAHSPQTGDALTGALREVGLSGQLAACYPHELSGGQRQRVAIARALAVRPQVILADEPTSALDIGMQSRVLNTLRDSQQNRGLSLLLISHDLPLVRNFCARIAVMYLGHVVEVFPVSVSQAPRHPYSQALLAAAPSLRAGLAGLTPVAMVGEAPSLLERPLGCPFAPRCPVSQDQCSVELPQLERVGAAHWLRCPVAIREGN